jgi:hypothetical protein
MIKRIIRGLVVGSLTFAIGVSVASFWKEPGDIGLPVGSIWHGQQVMSLCEVNSNPPLYRGKTIRFRSFVERGAVNTTAIAFCSTGEIASASLELDPNVPSGFPWPASRATSTGDDDQVYLTDAVIVGQLDPGEREVCFGPKFSVRQVKIEKILSAKLFDDSPKAVEWVKSNSDF